MKSSNKTYKKQFCLLTFYVVLLIIFILVGIYIFLRLPGRDMVLPLKEVKVFTRTEKINNYLLGRDAWRASLNGEKGLHTIENLRYSSPSIEDFFLRQQAQSNKDGYHVINKDTLLAYDINGNAIKKISISEFGLNPNEHYFNEILDLSEEKIWLAVYHLESSEWKNARLSIIEWPLAASPKDAIVAKIGDLHAASYYIAIDKDDSVAFVFCGIYSYDNSTEKKLNGIYDLHKKEFVRYFPHVKSGFSNIDYKKEKGLLLSNLQLIDSNTGKVRFLANGSDALWGLDDDIYFIRGTGQLWRCKSDGSNQEPIFLATKFPVNTKHISKLWLSSDRTFLVFDYAAPLMTGGKRTGIVFMDLDRKEFFNIAKGSSHPMWKPGFLMN